MRVKAKYLKQHFAWLVGAALVISFGLLSAQADGNSPAGEVIETETGIYYTVKEGDTLWGLSRKFSDSPYLWPNLWSKNDQISNPHLIYPGEKIQLYRRQDSEQITEPEQEQEKAPVVAAVVEEPKPETEPTPLKQSVEEEPELGEFTLSKIDQVGFIRRDPAEAFGKIFKVRDPKEMISSGDIVYVSEVGEHKLITGNRYTVYRALTKVWDGKTNDYIGIQHYLLGVIEVTRTEPEYVIAKVVTSNLNMKVGDLVMPYERRSQSISRKKSPDGIRGEIIMAENHAKIIGDYSVAFINKGEKDGILPGQKYSIFYQENERVSADSSKTVLLQPVDYGAFVVLLTEETTATVYITSASHSIRPGAKFRSPDN